MDTYRKVAPNTITILELVITFLKLWQISGMSEKTNVNYVHDEVKIRLDLDNAFCHQSI